VFLPLFQGIALRKRPIRVPCWYETNSRNHPVMFDCFATPGFNSLVMIKLNVSRCLLLSVMLAAEILPA
jgi:hypothetical protein